MKQAEINHLYFNMDLNNPEKTYRKRRQHLYESVKTPIIITGIETDTHPDHLFSHFKPVVTQDPAMIYLTGINQPKCVLLICKNEHILFLDPKNPKHEFWEGVKLGVSNPSETNKLATLLGVDQIYPIATFKKEIKNRFSKQKSIYAYWHTKSNKSEIKDHHYRLKNSLKRTLSNCTIKNIQDKLTTQRLICDKEDLDTLTAAIKKTNIAFKNTLKCISDAKTETDISASLNSNIAVQSYFQNSFSSIVAHGKNACVLHYTKNNAKLNKSHLLLLDFGIRWHGMCSDISRTIPLSGQFNPLQKLMYTIVLATQKTVQNACKPGITIDKLNNICWDYMNSELQNKIIDKGGKIQKEYDAQPHNVGHLIAHQVHDGDYAREYKSTPLVAGNIITNEPGFYGHVNLKINGKTYSEYIGIRIEDNLLITKNGCENLSKAIPKTVNQIETLLNIN